MKDNTGLIQEAWIGNHPYGSHKTAIEALKSEYFGDLSGYGRLAERRENVRERFQRTEFQQAVRMAEMAIIAGVTSVRTVTDRWERLTTLYIGGRIDAQEFAQSTHDGTVKGEKIEHVFNSEIPEMATERLRDGDVDSAVQALNGRITGDTDDTYLRTTKAHFVVWLLGFDRVCVDHRIHRALVPVIDFLFLDQSVRRDSKAGEYGRVDAKAKNPREVEFWHDILKWSPEVYHELTSGIVSHVNALTGIPKDRVAQVAFNVGGDGERTHHGRLFRLLAGP